MEVKRLTATKVTKGSSAAVFKLKKGIFGCSKSLSDPVMITDPSSGLPVMTPDKIKSVT